MYSFVSACSNCAYPIVPGAVDILKQSRTRRKRKCSFSMDEVMHAGFLVVEKIFLRIISSKCWKP